MMYDGLWPLCPDRYILSGFQTTSGTLIPNMRQVPLSGGGGGMGLSTCLVNILPYSVELDSQIVR